MKKVIVSAFVLMMCATVSHAQDVKKSTTATAQTQTASKPEATQQPAQPQSDKTAQTASNTTTTTTNTKQPDTNKKSDTTPQAK
jgi:hypothetical protein